MKVSDLELSVRASNCLESVHVATVGELVGYTESDLLRVRSFGKTSLREVKKKLSEMGLALGMRRNPAAALAAHTGEGFEAGDDQDPPELGEP